MHELGIVFHVIRAVEGIGREQKLTDVASVTLELGEVSGAIPHELVSCWNWAVKRTELLRARGAEDRDTPRRDALRGLRRGVSHRAPWRICPHCGSEKDVAPARKRDQYQGN